MSTKQAPQPPRFIYRIDDSDRIVYVNAAWREFARENDAAALTRRVYGTTLWDHIRGTEVVRLYQILVQKTRQDGCPRQFGFRCDSPQTRREMQMTIRRLPAGLMEFESQLVRVEPHPRAAVLDAKAKRSAELIVMCAWCLKVKSDGWIELEDAIEDLALFKQRIPPRISHGICHACHETLLSQIR